MQQAKLSIELSDEAKQQIYADVLHIAKLAVKEATEGVPDKRHVTQAELMKLYRIGKVQVDQWIDDGLKVLLIGRKKMFDMEDVYSYLDKQKI